MDYQQSLMSKAEKAKILSGDPPYEVLPASLSQFASIKPVLEKSGDRVVLIDLPGLINDNGLIPVFNSTRLVLSPFSYDAFSVDSTVLFAMVFRKINPKAQLLFIPNRIKNTVKYETRTEVDRVLSKFGHVCPGISDRIDFQRISTVNTPEILYPVVNPILDLIYESYILKYE